MWGRVPARGPLGALSGAGLTVSTQGLQGASLNLGEKWGCGEMGKGSQQVLGEHWLQPPGTRSGAGLGTRGKACAHLAAVGRACPQQSEAGATG